jgi:hypothetical protein
VGRTAGCMAETVPPAARTRNNTTLEMLYV